MSNFSATALAHPNIALIKYWGNRDEQLRLPVNGSISFNLAELSTRTKVAFNESLPADLLFLNGRPAAPPQTERISHLLDLVREMAHLSVSAKVESENNFPTGSGIASSASGFAALTLAASVAAGLSLSPEALSRLARRGSGSACRSIPAGFTEWLPGEDDASSYAISIAPPDHWDLIDIIVLLDSNEKKIGSTEGHTLAPTSPLQAARVADTPRRLDICRHAIFARDFSALAEIVEQDCVMMHAVMMTSSPALFYWEPATLQLMQLVSRWRAEGLTVAYTIDAGPNLHLIAPASSQDALRSELHRLPVVKDLFITHPGPRAEILQF